MKEFVYYPGFEVRNQNWLKFALLFLGNLDPIIPYSGDKVLSDQWRQILNETDLLKINRPNNTDRNLKYPKFEEGYAATLDAIDQMEKIFRHPERYEFIFNTPNIIELWKNPANQTWTLFEEKYSEAWNNFCEGNNIANYSNQGLMLPREVCLIYMTILAQCIADSKGISPITDHKSLDKFSIFTRKSTKSEADSIKISQQIINLSLPKNLNELSLKRIIGLRKKDTFKKRQSAFHDELNKFLSNVENGKNIEKFSDSLGSAWLDFKDDILGIGTGVAAFGLGVWIFFQSSGIGLPVAAEKVVGGISMALGASTTIKKTWKHTENKRLSRKYLADLSILA